MADRVVLRRSTPPARERGVLGLAMIFLLTGGALLMRSWWEPSAPEGMLIEVSGEVAAPGSYLVDPPTLAAAVEAAGGLSAGVPETPLQPGDAVRVEPDGVRVVPAGDPLLVALPVDVNVNGAAALAAVPGLGERLGEAIVATRDATGPFYALDDLLRVPGVGRDTLEAAGPFLTVGDVGLRPPVDVNTATAVELRALPGVGPVLAERIVADRAASGPFADVEALDRVHGIGPALVGKLRDRVVAGAP